MELIKKYKNILIGLGVVIVLFVLYSMFFGGPEEELLVVETAQGSSEVAQEDIIALLSRVQSITLDNSFFSRRDFRSLLDFGVTLTGEDKGRLNPFAPIDGLRRGSIPEPEPDEIPVETEGAPEEVDASDV